MLRSPGEIHIINKNRSIKHGISYDIWSMQNIQNTKQTLDLLRIYIYIYAYICVSEFTKGVGLVVCMFLQNDVFLPKECERKMTPKIWEFPAADCVAHGASFLGQFVFQPWNWSSLYQNGSKRITLPETSTANHLKKKTLKVASRWSFLCGVSRLRGANCSFFFAKMLYLATRSTHWPFNLAAQGAKTWLGKTLRDWWIDTLFSGHHFETTEKTGRCLGIESYLHIS